jgi:hypothetical protein
MPAPFDYNHATGLPYESQPPLQRRRWIRQRPDEVARQEHVVVADDVDGVRCVSDGETHVNVGADGLVLGSRDHLGRKVEPGHS